jgi:hypothetical protein
VDGGDEDSGNVYLYVSELSGYTTQRSPYDCQLVRDVASGEYRMRKIYMDLEIEESKKELNEIRMAILIADRRRPPGFDRPSVVRLLSANNMEFQPSGNLSAHDDIWARDSYWDFCNFYSFGKWFARGKPSIGAPPYAFIGRYMKQMIATIRFWHHALGKGDKPINNWDLEMFHVFLDWPAGKDLPSAYIGNLCWANDGDPIANHRDSTLDDCDMLATQLDQLISLAPERAVNSDRHKDLTKIQTYMNLQNRDKDSRNSERRRLAHNKAALDKLIDWSRELEKCLSDGPPRRTPDAVLPEIRPLGNRRSPGSV